MLRVQTRIHAVVSDNQNHVHAPQQSAKKNSRKSLAAWSVTKYNIRHQKLGCGTRLQNQVKQQTNKRWWERQADQRATMRRKNKHFYTYEKRKINERF